MRKNKYCIMLEIDDNYIGSMIIKAKDEHNAYIEFMKFLIKSNIALQSRVEISIEKI